ncbi:hypothetical protein EV175_003093 [Coemansia sp. RSA 1933]|nr:hypothetical protein EV175_003093 [Coemansia sp. RSA 1933]
MQRDPNVSVITLSDDDNDDLTEYISRRRTPVPRRISTQPGTPDLPSPSVLLGRSSDDVLVASPIALHTSNLLQRHGAARMSRQEALDLPSSPILDSSDAPDDPRYLVDSDSNECEVLGDTRPFRLSSPPGSPLPQAPRYQPRVEFSDVATEILSSSDESVDLPSRELNRLTNRGGGRRQRTQGQKEQKERERQFAKDLSAVNRKRVEAKDIAGDITVVVEPGLMDLVSEDTPAGIQRSASARAPPTPSRGALVQRSNTASQESHTESVLFAPLQADGIGYRIAAQKTSGAAIRWELTRRRRWDSRQRMYVPVPPLPPSMLKTAAMVVLTSTRFLELIAAARLRGLLEIWRASLAVHRIFVVVLGLTRAMRRMAGAGSREFDRQMRQLLRDGAVQPTQPPCEDSGSVSEETVEMAVLEMQLACPWVTWFTQCTDARALGRLVHRTTVDLALGEVSQREGGEEEEGGGALGGDVATALRVAVVKTGGSLKESWALALAQIPKVTVPVAQAIAARYPTPRSLFEAWDAAQQSSPAEMLADTVVPGAAAGGRRLGSTVSARIHGVLTEADPTRPFAEL